VVTAGAFGDTECGDGGAVAGRLGVRMVMFLII
jgi:hypothetical protein